ncbi:MAG: helix-turn-helix domain-containing protein [Acidimicrobiia bacterium]
MCFANADGGHLIVGVADRPGGIGALRGVTASVMDVRKGICERTNPNLVVDIAEYRPPEAADVRLMVFDVPRGQQVYSVAGRVTMRMGTGCKALSPVEVHRLYTSRQGLDITAEPTDLGFDDVSAAAIDIVRRRLRAMPEAGREIADLPGAELLRNLKLLDDQGRLRRAGALLLTDSQGDDARLVYVHRVRSSAEPDFSIQLTAGVLWRLGGRHAEGYGRAPSRSIRRRFGIGRETRSPATIGEAEQPDRRVRPPPVAGRTRPVDAVESTSNRR